MIYPVPEFSPQRVHIHISTMPCSYSKPLICLIWYKEYYISFNTGITVGTQHLTPGIGSACPGVHVKAGTYLLVFRVGNREFSDVLRNFHFTCRYKNEILFIRQCVKVMVCTRIYIYSKIIFPVDFQNDHQKLKFIFHDQMMLHTNISLTGVGNLVYLPRVLWLWAPILNFVFAFCTGHYGGWYLPRIIFFSGISNAFGIQGGANICNAF